MKNFLLLAISLSLILGCSPVQNQHVFIDGSKQGFPVKPFSKRIKHILSNYQEKENNSALSITYPYDGAVFPPEIAAPQISWKSNSNSQEWLIICTFTASPNVLYALTQEKKWEPKKTVWDKIKKLSTNSTAKITILGLSSEEKNTVVSENSIQFSTSTDQVNASIFYRQVPLPFPKDFKKVKWRLGDISSYSKPKVVMENIEVCASCHVFSSDGKAFSMEMNYDNDSGTQFIKPVQEEIVLSKEDFFSWSDFPRGGIIPKTRGLFGRMSPSGKFVAASVNEISLALLTNEAQFSQVFFPTYGILAYYSLDHKQIKPLPGADDYNYVQANPNWSPDEKSIVFARSKTKNEVHDDLFNVAPKRKDASIHELNKIYNIQFDLYTIPFNNGKGGDPAPLQGASNNGMSNYFARHSPDGKWIVFTQSQTGIMLQPDSQLFIIPTEGGVARKMNCNRSLFNSWHSWSPNGKWLLFSSKVNTPFTEIFLTHIDEWGNDSPPILLSRFSDSEYAANIPEFVNIPYNAINKIVVQ